MSHGESSSISYITLQSVTIDICMTEPCQMSGHQGSSERVMSLRICDLQKYHYLSYHRELHVEIAIALANDDNNTGRCVWPNPVITIFHG